MFRSGNLGAALVMLCVVATGCREGRSPEQVSAVQTQKRIDYDLKLAQLNREEAEQRAALHRDIFDQKVKAWSEVAAAQVKANAQLSPGPHGGEARDLASIEATRQLELLDGRVTELRAVAATLDPARRDGFTASFNELSPLRANAVEAIDALQDEWRPLARAQNDSQRRLNAFASAISMLGDRIDRASRAQS